MTTLRRNSATWRLLRTCRHRQPATGVCQPRDQESTGGTGSTLTTAEWSMHLPATEASGLGSAEAGGHSVDGEADEFFFLLIWIECVWVDLSHFYETCAYC
jgi:hypothetical protein